MSKVRWMMAAAAMVFGGAAYAADPAAAQNVGGVEGSGGTVKGIVKFDGRMATRRPIRMDQDPFCASAHTGDAVALNEMFVFGEGPNKEPVLQNVLVYVTKGLEGKTFPAPEKPALMDQINCVYVPHVLAMVAGQPLHIHNSDSTLHNVKMTSSNNGSFNEGMPVKDMVLEKTLAKPEMGVSMKCDVHPWMGSYVHVLPHPFFAVTGADGTFTIKGLPPGEYEVSVRHEFDKFTPTPATATVTVEEGKEATTEFTYRPPGGN